MFGRWLTGFFASTNLWLESIGVDVGLNPSIPISVNKSVTLLLRYKDPLFGVGYFNTKKSNLTCPTLWSQTPLLTVSLSFVSLVYYFLLQWYHQQ